MWFPPATPRFEVVDIFYLKLSTLDQIGIVDIFYPLFNLNIAIGLAQYL